MYILHLQYAPTVKRYVPFRPAHNHSHWAYTKTDRKLQVGGNLIPLPAHTEKPHLAPCQLWMLTGSTASLKPARSLTLVAKEWSCRCVFVCVLSASGCIGVMAL